MVRMAAIAVTPEIPGEALLDALLPRLRADGWRLGGHLQRHVEEGCDCSQTLVEDVASGERLRISQALGRASQGCRLDSSALAEVAVRGLRSLESGPQLLLVNRFGKVEAEGGGLRVLFERAMELDVPLLTTVKRDHQDAWRDYVDDLAVLLPPSLEAVHAWCLSVR